MKDAADATAASFVYCLRMAAAPTSAGHKALRTALATRDFNLETLRGAEITGEELGSLLGTPPMMAERRVVVVRDVGALRKDARRSLDQYLEHPASDVVLIAIAGSKEDRA